VFLTAAAAALVIVLFQAGSAQAIDVRAGPIFTSYDAEVKCPKTCEWYLGWNGHWTVAREAGQMSVCGCKGLAEGGPNDTNAGSIWGNHDAPHKCQEATRWYGGWNGQWRTTREGQMSVWGPTKTGTDRSNRNSVLISS